MPTYKNFYFGGFDGPKPTEIDETVLKTDLKKYAELKSTLLIQTVLGRLFGTVTVGLVKGTDDSLRYLAGALAGVGSLYLLSLNTDTIRGKNTKIGGNVSNL